MELVRAEVAALAGSTVSGAQKQEAARKALKAKLYGLLGKVLDGSTINLLIEKAIVDEKAAAKP